MKTDIFIWKISNVNRYYLEIANIFYHKENN